MSEQVNSTRTAVAPSGMTHTRQTRKLDANNKVPFNACFFSILTIVGVLQLSAMSPNVGSILSFALSLYTFEWFVVHFHSMTRAFRASFDVKNVLETYQPRNRTHGHLFVPDPPTPAVTIAETGTQHDMPKEKNAFSNARDAHYENMFQKAMQMNKEMDQMGNIAASPSLDSAQDFELKPADPEKDKKESEEKAKQAKKKYDEDMAKPFSC